jgi:hypothetical protein
MVPGCAHYYLLGVPHLVTLVVPHAMDSSSAPGRHANIGASVFLQQWQRPLQPRIPKHLDQNHTRHLHLAKAAIRADVMVKASLRTNINA